MDEKIVQGDFKRHAWWRSRRFAIAVIVVASIALLGGAFQFWRIAHNRSQQRTAAYNTMLTQSNTFVTKRQYDLAEQITTWYLAGKPPAAYKRNATLQLASIYSNAGDLSHAIIWYKNTANLDKAPQLDVTTGLAYTYQALKDSKNAITYFRQAITLEQKTNAPDKNSVITTYQYLIKQMGGAV